MRILGRYRDDHIGEIWSFFCLGRLFLEIGSRKARLDRDLDI